MTIETLVLRLNGGGAGMMPGFTLGPEAFIFKRRLAKVEVRSVGLVAHHVHGLSVPDGVVVRGTNPLA